MISEQSTDQELVAALNAGEWAAFDILYHRYRDWVLKMAWRVTRHHDDSLDVLQETFAWLARCFPGFELRAAMTTFLYPAVRNFSIAARRKRERLIGTFSEAHAIAEPEARPESRRSDVAEILGGLPDDQQEILLLRFVDDLSQSEIAQRLNLPVGTVKSRLHHAIKSLRNSPAAKRLH